MKTIAKILAEKRAEKEMSYYTLAKRSKIRHSTIWKYEMLGALPKPATLRKLFCNGLSVIHGSNEWNEIQAAWSTQKMGRVVTADDLADSAIKINDNASVEAKKLMKVITKLSSDEVAELLKAVDRPSVMQSLKISNRIFEGKKVNGTY